MQGETVAVRQDKTGTALLIPIHPELATALAPVPRRDLSLLAGCERRPLRSAGFGNWFRDQCNFARPPRFSADRATLVIHFYY